MTEQPIAELRAATEGLIDHATEEDCGLCDAYVARIREALSGLKSAASGEARAYVDGDYANRELRWMPDMPSFDLPLGTKLYAAPVAVQEEGYAAKVLKDLRWRLGDIRDMLMKQNHLGDSIYGCDEWSTPTVNLATAIGVIDKALAAMKGDKP